MLTSGGMANSPLAEKTPHHTGCSRLSRPPRTQRSKKKSSIYTKKGVARGEGRDEGARRGCRPTEDRKRDKAKGGGRRGRAEQSEKGKKKVRFPEVRAIGLVGTLKGGQLGGFQIGDAQKEGVGSTIGLRG